MVPMVGRWQLGINYKLSSPSAIFTIFNIFIVISQSSLFTIFIIIIIFKCPDGRLQSCILNTLYKSKSPIKGAGCLPAFHGSNDRLLPPSPQQCSYFLSISSAALTVVLWSAWPQQWRSFIRHASDKMQYSSMIRIHSNGEFNNHGWCQRFFL